MISLFCDLFKNQIPATIALLCGLCFATFNILGFDLSFLPGDLADTRFNIYILEHAHQYFFTDNVPTEGYWNAPFMYPQESIITFSDNLLGTFLIYSLFRALGADIYLSFQLWMITITILNFCAANFLFRYLTKNKHAAALGAFVFAFSIALVSQYAHPQTYPRFCIPIAIYFAVKFQESFNVKYFFGMVFFVVFQIYCVVYLGFMLAVPLAVFLILTLIIKWKSFAHQLKVRFFLLAIGSLIFNILILLPLVIPYMNSPSKFRPNGDVLFRKYSEIVESIPSLESYFFMHRHSLLWNDLSEIGKGLSSWWNQQLFPGAITYISMIVILFFSTKRIKNKVCIPMKYWALSISFLITFLFYVRFGGFSLYSYLFELPGYNAVRALHRIINVELVFFGLFVSVSYLLLSKYTKRKMAFFLIFLGLTVCDNQLIVSSNGLNRVEKILAKERLELLVKEMRSQSSNGVISYEPTTSDKKSFVHIDAMLAAQTIGLRTLNGYSGNVPNGYYHYAVFSKKGRSIWLQKKQLKEKVVVINELYDSEIERIIQKISANQTWLRNIKKQAKNRGISLEENLKKNAVWIDEQNRNKK